MALKVIEPSQIQVYSNIPVDFAFSGAYYLGYGRNAWHSTWINRYYPSCISFDIEELKRNAEVMRKQGNVFKIQSIPMLILTYEHTSYGISPINELERHNYKFITLSIKSRTPSNFWLNIPSSCSDWIITFSFESNLLNNFTYIPLKVKSYSSGTNFYLGWSRETPEIYPRFDNFCWDLLDHLTS